MALGDKYTHFAKDTFAKITDSDICFIDTIGSVILGKGMYLVVKHEELDMASIPIITLGGAKFSPSEWPKGTLLNARRVSATQTVYTNLTDASLEIEVTANTEPFPSRNTFRIGEMVIGSSFKVT